LAAISTKEELGKLVAKYKMMGKVAESNKAMIFLGNDDTIDITPALLAKLNEIEKDLSNNRDGGVS
jgi:hypothetical protein